MKCPHCGKSIPGTTEPTEQQCYDARQQVMNFESTRAHVMSEAEYKKYTTKGTKNALQVKQEIKDTYKGTQYTGVDVYSPSEELLFRVSIP